jgi:hypothetical protein
MNTLGEWLLEVPGWWFAIGIFIGTVLSAGGSFLVLMRQGAISQDIRTQVKGNLERTKSNLEQTREAANRIEEAIGHLTGGDSYCYFLPLVTGPATNKLSLVIHVKTPVSDKGKYPLYDVTADIGDRDRTKQLGPPSSIPEWRSRQRSVTIGNLSPEFARMVDDWDLAPGDTHRYIIRFFTKNSTFSQNLVLRMVNGRWSVASQVMRGGEVIPGSKSIDSDFPRDEHGQPQW